MQIDNHKKIMYEGPIIAIALGDGTQLYSPQTLPDKPFTRKYDQVIACGANERSTDEIVSFDHHRGILETEDRLRSPSMRRWRLVDIFLTGVGMVGGPETGP